MKNRTTARRSGFTLAEVLVAVPLLVLVFWIVGTIFVTTRDTVNLGMVHAKVTATAESAVQRMARDLMGLRSDGRLVFVAYRVNPMSINRDDTSVAGQVPGVYGHMAFISQLTALSRSAGSTRANVARVLYRPAQRLDSTNAAVPYWDTQVMMREALLYVYNPAAVRVPPNPEIPVLLQPDVLGFPSTSISVGAGTVAQPRTDLVQQAVDCFRTSTYANGAARLENFGGVFPFGGVGGGASATMYPSPVTPADVQAFYSSLMLPRCALIYNGNLAPPTGTLGLSAGPPPRYPRGVLNPDPATTVALQDPGAAAFFQWWGQDDPTQVDPGGRPLKNWHPTIGGPTGPDTIPLAGALPATSFYYRKFMYIKTPEDVLEYDNQAPYNQGPSAPAGGVNRAPNGAPSSPSGAGKQVSWPDAVRVNMMLFDRVGRFRAGALFQAVIDLPSSR